MAIVLGNNYGLLSGKTVIANGNMFNYIWRNQQSLIMKTELIHKITNIKVQVHKGNQPFLHLLVLGETESGNHINPRLERREYIDFPQDGVQEYDLFIDISDKPTDEHIKNYGVEDEWYDFPEELTGIKVYGKTNEMERKVKIEGDGVSIS